MSNWFHNFPNSSTSQGPSVQTLKPVGSISHSSHSPGTATLGHHPLLAGTQAHARAHTTLPLPQSGPTDLLLSLRRVLGANLREKGLPGSAGPSWARLGESSLFSVAPKAGTRAQSPRLPLASRAIAA